MAQQLSEEQLDRLVSHTGRERRDIRLLVLKLQAPDVTRDQQLKWIARLTGRSPGDLAQAVRQRRQDAQLQPALARLLRRLRLMRGAPEACYTAQCRMPLEKALRLAALLERQCETDGYRYSTQLRVMDASGALRHELRVSWRHQSQYQRESYDALFAEEQ
jgi:hypothetical protein